MGLPDSMGSRLPSWTYNALEIAEDSCAFDSKRDMHNTSTVQSCKLVPLHVSAACELDEVIMETVKIWRQKALRSGYLGAKLSESVSPTVSRLLNHSHPDGSE